MIFSFLVGCDSCLLYTSDAADELDGVDLGGRRIIKKKFFQAEDGIRDQPRSRGLGDVYKRQCHDSYIIIKFFLNFHVSPFPNDIFQD